MMEFILGFVGIILVFVGIIIGRKTVKVQESSKKEWEEIQLEKRKQYLQALEPFLLLPQNKWYHYQLIYLIQ